MLKTILRRAGVLQRRTDWYGQAEEGRRLPAAEIEVAAAALEGSGTLGARFVAQLRNAQYVWRLIAPSGRYEARVSVQGPGVRGVPRDGWTSAAIPVRTTKGRDLELRLHVFEMGAIELLGETVDRKPWPKSWSVDPASLTIVRSRAPWLSLPSAKEVREQRRQAADTVETWLGEPGGLSGKRGVISVLPPATNNEIAVFEAAQEFALPPAYRDLLRLANGIEVGSTVVLGTADAYRLDIAGPDRLVISPPDVSGALTLASDGAVYFVDVDAQSSDGRLRAKDLRQWVLKAGGRPAYQVSRDIPAR